MKRITQLLLTGVVYLTAQHVNAQLYINPQVGYGLPALKASVGQNFTATTSSTTYDGVRTSLGAGIQPQLFVGYQLIPHFGIEAGYSYLLGAAVESKYDDTSDPLQTVSGSDKWQATMQRVSIGGRVSFEKGKIAPFVRGGVVIGFGAKSVYEFSRTTTSSGSSSTLNRTIEYTGGTAIGFTCGVGLGYQMSEMFAINLEGGFIGQNYSPAHGELTVYEFNGQDQLSNTTVRDRETDFVETLTIDNAPVDTNKPAQALKDYMPMSSWGFSLGVQLKFGGK